LAGYLEGRVSADDISNFLENTEKNNSADKKAIDSILKFFKEVAVNMYKRIDTLKELCAEDKEYYYKIYTFYAQINGLLKGINTQRKLMNMTEVTMERLLLIQADGEVPELISILVYLS
jgi:hypothetical protein